MQNINLKAFANLEITVWAQFVREICCSLNLHKYSLACQPGNMVTHRKRPTPLLTLGVGVHTQAKKSDDFLQYALGGCQFTEIWSHLWHKMWEFTTYKSVTNDPPIFEPICG